MVERARGRGKEGLRKVREITSGRKRVSDEEELCVCVFGWEEEARGMFFNALWLGLDQYSCFDIVMRLFLHSGKHSRNNKSKVIEKKMMIYFYSLTRFFFALLGRYVGVQKYHKNSFDCFYVIYFLRVL